VKWNALPSGLFNDYPCDAIIGPGGDLFVAEAGVAPPAAEVFPVTINSRILRFNGLTLAFEGVVAEINGNGVGSLLPPMRVAFQSGLNLNVYTNLAPTNPPSPLGPQSRLWTVNTANGSVSPISGVSNVLSGLVFGPDGNLWATETTFAAGAQVESLNPSTGQVLSQFVPQDCQGQYAPLTCPGPLVFGPEGSLYVPYDTLTGGRGISVYSLVGSKYQLTTSIALPSTSSAAFELEYPLAFDNAGDLYVATDYSPAVYKISSVTGPSPSVAQLAAGVSFPAAMAYEQIATVGLIPSPVHNFPWGLLSSGSILNLSLLNTASALAASQVCQMQVQFVNSAGTVLASNNLAINPGQTASTSFSGTAVPTAAAVVAGAQQVRPVLYEAVFEPPDPCGATRATLELLNSSTLGTLLNIPEVTPGNVNFGPAGLIGSQTAQLSFQPPDPCSVQVSWIGPDGSVLSQSGPTPVAANQLQTFDFQLASALAAPPQTEVHPVIQPVTGQGSCGSAISSLEIFNTSTGAPAAVYIPQN
jgi:hypothetical protein